MPQRSWFLSRQLKSTVVIACAEVSTPWLLTGQLFLSVFSFLLLPSVGNENKIIPSFLLSFIAYLPFLISSFFLGIPEPQISQSHICLIIFGINFKRPIRPAQPKEESNTQTRKQASEFGSAVNISLDRNFNLSERGQVSSRAPNLVFSPFIFSCFCFLLL